MKKLIIKSQIKRKVIATNKLIIYCIRYGKYLLKVLLWKINHNKKIANIKRWIAKQILPAVNKINRNPIIQNSLKEVILFKKAFSKYFDSYLVKIKSTLTDKTIPFVKKNPFLFVIYTLSSIIFIFNTFLIVRYFNTPRPAKIHITGKKAEYLYTAKNSIYSAQIGGKKNNVPKVEFAVGKSKISFEPASGKANPAKPQVKDNTLLFKDIYPNIDMKYEPITKGIKEEIIINKPTEIKTFPFFLDLQGAIPKYVSENINGTVFYDASGKYLFHFEKPFAIDVAGARTDKVGIIIKKDSATGKYTAIIQTDPNWFNSPERKYPIIIDPTIIHDTTVEFATGQFNRVKDTGSGASPSLQNYYQELPADINTVGLWHMNEGTDNTCSGGQDVCDKSTNGNHGTFYNNMAFTSSSKIGNYATISDATGDSICLDDVELANGKQFTVEAWFKLNTLTEYESIVAKNSSYYAYALQGDTTSGILRFWVDDNDYTTDAQSNASVADGQWHHAAGVYDGTLGSANTKLYIDGVLQTQTANQTINIPNTADQLCFGGYNTSGSGSVDGSIDEIRISNIARTPEEIKMDANQRPYSIYTSDVIDLTAVTSWNSISWTESGVLTGDGETLYSSTNLVAQWNFNATSGTPANNDAEGTSCGGTPANCDGTLTNFGTANACLDTQDDTTAGCATSGWTANNRRWGAGGVMFDGTNDYVTIPDSDALDPQYISVETWVFPTDSGSGRILGKQTSGTNLGGYILYRNSDTTFSFYVYAGGAWRFTPGVASIPTGQWSHLVGTYDGTTLKAYINGNLVNTASYTGTINNTTATLRLGDTEYTGDSFAGVIDSTRIYSRTLTASEILSNYQSANIELQTRVGSSATADDGTWETWGPSTNESAIDSLDTSGEKWTVDSNQNSSSTISKISGVNTGTGADSDCIMNNGTKTLDSTAGSSVCNSSARSTAYAVNFSDTTLEKAGETSVDSSTTPTGLLAGDEILIINLQGTSTNYDSVGKYETHIISSISTNTLNFTDYPLSNTYDGTTQKIMIQRVPNFGNITICGGNTGGGCTAAATLNATAWNGTKNGVLFFRSTGAVTINSGGAITTTGLGYRGGSTATTNVDYSYGYAGERTGGSSSVIETTSSAYAGGGGGAGKGAEASGGGGGLGRDGSDGSKYLGGSDYGRGASHHSQETSNRLILGGGGGSAGSHSAGRTGAAGGAGGGIIFISADTIGTTNIISNGNNGTNGTYISDTNSGAGGGAGAGGSIVLTANSITNSTTTATGGTGGIKDPSSNGTNGGNGSVGRIALYYTTSLSGSTTPIAYTQKLQSQIKQEGTSAMQLTAGRPEVDSGTVALWHLDETTGTGAYIKDSTANANNGTPTGTTVVNGFFGKARNFANNSDSISLGDVAFIDGLTKMSVSFWLYPTTLATTKMIISKTNWSNQDSFGIRTSDSASDEIMVFICSALNDAGSNYLQTTNLDLVTNQWTHITVVYDGTLAAASRVAVYKNGSAISGSVTGTLPTSMTSGSTSNLKIGLGDYATQYALASTIDEMKIDSTARTAEEAAEAYRAGRDHRITKTITSKDLSAAGTKLPFYVASDRQGTFMEATIGESAFANYLPDANTVGLWHLEEQSGSGAYFKDSSGNGNHGSIGGTPTFAQGKIGKARYFNGSTDYISLGDPASLDFSASDSFSVETWAKTTTAAETRIYGKYKTATAPKVMIAFGTKNSGQLNIELRGNTYASFVDLSSTKYINDGNWHHLVMTYDNPNDLVTLWIDGAKNNSTTWTGDGAMSSDVNNYIGSINGSGNLFPGTIDEVRVSNSARTADEIRQAYEVGLRTHPITIDFKSSLAHTNNIYNASDLSFTLTATASGSTNAGDNIFKGDKIIVKENIDGTEYLAQGTVNAVTISTGATTVASWDSGSTFPTNGYSPNATVFKWQREFFDVGQSLSTHRDAITNITLRVVDGSQGANVWLDDFRSNSAYLTTPAGSGIASSTGSRYAQYRAIFTNHSPVASLSMVTLDYESNQPPATATISANFLHDKVKTADTTPEIRFTTTDPESEDVTYQISWDTDSSFPAATSKTSDTDAGFANVTTPADIDPFNSGDIVSYTFQSALTNNTTYFYRVRAKDPAGSNTYSSWSSILSFTIDTTLNKGNHWFETHADQFSTDTLATTIVSDANNNVYTPPSNTTIDLMEYATDGTAQSAYVSNGYFYATGGTIATASGYTTHTFTTVETTSLGVSGSKNAEVLVVAGGGGGGAYTGQAAGSGGAGGMVEHSAKAVSSGNITVTVGGGGGGGSYSPWYAASPGGNSVFSDITALGGGIGGNKDNSGGNGGSGGGGGQANGGAGSATQGNSGGGTGYGNNGGGGGINYGGGGGGAGTAGGANVNGLGRSNSISGSPVTYAAGGIGGAANTGNGGTGGGSYGGSGSSGIVIVKYPSMQPLLAYSENSTKSQGSYALKGVAEITYALNKTLTHTVSPTINLSDFNTLKFDIRSTRTGSNIKIGIHDSGGTTTETTPNVASADTYQTVSWDVSGVTNANKDAIDQIIVTIVNADAENTFYIDNFYGESPTGGTGTITSTAITQTNINAGKTNWGTATVGKTETNGSLKTQVYYDNTGSPTIVPDGDLAGNSTGFSGNVIDLATVSTTTYPILYLKGNLVYSGGSPTLDEWGIIFDNRATTPTLDSPSAGAVSQPVRTVIKTTSTDSNSDYLKYKIQLCTDSSMTQNCQTFDQTSSQTGWSGQNTETNTAYTSGTQSTYTIQTGSLLIPNTTYYWRTYAKDPGGTNLWTDTQGAPRSFTTGVVPNIPTLDLPSDTATSQSIFPIFKTTGTDNDSDYLKYKIQLCKNIAMTTECSIFDQTSAPSGWSGMNANGNTAFDSGTQATYTVQAQLDFDTTYYWKSYSKDVDGSETWSSTQVTPYSFTTGEEPTQPTNLQTETASNPATVIDTTPEFSAICNHSVEGATLVKYQVQVDDDVNFGSTIWDSGGSGTVMSSCTAGQRSSEISYAGSTLSSNGNIYYWRIKFWDEWNLVSPWSTEQAFFVMDMDNAPDRPTSCRIKEATNESSLTLLWNDNSSSESQYRIEKNVDAVGFSLLINKAADSTTHTDLSVSANHTYQYRVRAEGSSNSEWCTTTIVDLSLGNFNLDGINLKGINIR